MVRNVGMRSHHISSSTKRSSMEIVVSDACILLFAICGEQNFDPIARLIQDKGIAPSANDRGAGEAFCY